MKKIGRMLLTGMALCTMLTGCGMLNEVSDPVQKAAQTDITQLNAGSSSDVTVQTTLTDLSGSALTESTLTEITDAATAASDTTLTAQTTLISPTSLTTTSSAAASAQTTTTPAATQTQSTSRTTQTTKATSVTSSAASTSRTTLTTVSSSAASSSATTKISAPANGNYTLTDSDKEFLADCVFVGDSICSGLSVYKILPKNNVCAKGCVAARSIFDYKFSVGGSNVGLITAMKTLKPKYVIFSMGMNDVNMTSAEKYCENYKGILTKVQDALPDAKLYVASITPITTTSTFCTNSRIDNFNSTIKTYLANNYPDWGYVDISSLLKNQYNALISSYTSGDGIHLAPKAYTAILYQVCAQLAPKSDTTAANG